MTVLVFRWMWYWGGATGTKDGTQRGGVRVRGEVAFKFEIERHQGIYED